MKKISIFIVEDHTLVREACALLLDADPRFEVVAKSGSAEETLPLVGALRPDVLLMDINLPGMNGIEAIPMIRLISPSTKILGVSMHTQVSLVRKMLREGASGYVAKGSSGDEIRQAIVDIHSGRKYICETIRNCIANNVITEENPIPAFESLSNREIQIIDFVKKGFSSKEISESMGISFKTVEAHRYNILKKLKLKNTPALINYINQAGFEFTSVRGVS